MSGRLGRGIYSGIRWRALRLDVLRSAGWRCRRCSRFGDEVHHIVRLADGGAAFDKDNLEPVCRLCHLDEHLHPDERRHRREWRGLVRQVLRGTA